MKQFIISTTFVVILVMVVISMAIIIPSTKIYEQTNNKIIDNQIDKVEINEKQTTQNTGIRSGIDRNIYEPGNSEGKIISYTRVFDKFNNYTLSQTVVGDSFRYCVEEKMEIKTDGEIDLDTFELYLKQTLAVSGVDSFQTASFSRKLERNTVTSKAEFDAIDETTQNHELEWGNFLESLINFVFVVKYAIDTNLSKGDSVVIYLKFAYRICEVEGDEYIELGDGGNTFVSFNLQPSYTSVTQTSTKIANGIGSNPILLSSNELITNLTTINSDTYTDIASAFVLSGYANGKETATVLCDISEYYDDNLVLSISTQNNALPMIFNVGDIVIPYVTKNVYDSITGTYSLTEVPLSIINGNPKLFKVVSNKIISDGVPRQKLTLVESDKLYVDNTTTCIATEITAVGLSVTTPTVLTYIPISDNLTTFTFNPRIGDGIKLIGFKGATVFPIWKYNDTEITFGSGNEYTRGNLATTNPYITFTASETTIGGEYECTRDTTINGFKVDFDGASVSFNNGGVFISGINFSTTENEVVYPATGKLIQIICSMQKTKTIVWKYNGNTITSGVDGYTIISEPASGISELRFTANTTNCNGTYTAIETTL